MTNKDWILLIIPIITNGILIVLFQSFINRKFQKYANFDEREKEIVERFLEMLFECLDVTAEVVKQFRFREDMEVINEKFRITISEMSRYGKNMDFVLHSSDQIEDIRVTSGICHNKLVRYQSFGKSAYNEFPMEEQQEIIQNDLPEIKEMLQELCKKIIRM